MADNDNTLDWGSDAEDVLLDLPQHTLLEELPEAENLLGEPSEGKDQPSSSSDSSSSDTSSDSSDSEGPRPGSPQKLDASPKGRDNSPDVGAKPKGLAPDVGKPGSTGPKGRGIFDQSGQVRRPGTEVDPFPGKASRSETAVKPLLSTLPTGTIEAMEITEQPEPDEPKQTGQVRRPDTVVTGTDKPDRTVMNPGLLQPGTC